MITVLHMIRNIVDKGRRRTKAACNVLLNVSFVVCVFLVPLRTRTESGGHGKGDACVFDRAGLTKVPGG